MSMSFNKTLSCALPTLYRMSSVFYKKILSAKFVFIYREFHSFDRDFYIFLTKIKKKQHMFKLN